MKVSPILWNSRSVETNPGAGPMTLKKTLEEMQGGLLLIMDAVKKGNTQEAERLLLIVGGLLDRALRAERLK
jgi:hypothetical protein